MIFTEETLRNSLAQKAIIFSYLRNEKGNKTGMLVGWRDNGSIFISYSLLNPGDKFNKLQEIDEAIKKYYSSRDTFLLSSDKAFGVTYELSHFMHRCAQYFKTSNLNIHIPIVQRKLKNVKTSSES